MTAFTDPARKFRNDPGHPEICNIYRLHDFYTSLKMQEIGEKCRTAQIGCVECKRLLAENINKALVPFREKRAQLAEKQGYVQEVIADGARRAQAIARETIKEVKDKMGLP
jgi:tryptophanyl-tRNA synthetase